MTKQTDHDARQALQANKSNGGEYIGKGTIPAANGDRITYEGDESEDDSPHQSLIDDMIDVAKGTLILAVCFGVCGFVYGRYF